jgi:hypothetical protein
MKNLLFTFAFALFSLLGYTQEVFVVSHQSEADYLIYETDNASEADWVVMKAKFKNQAVNGVWYLTDNKGEADFTIFYVTDKAKADKVVAYTDFATGIKFKLD